jgi:hypothetical protein
MKSRKGKIVPVQADQNVPPEPKRHNGQIDERTPRWFSFPVKKLLWIFKRPKK